MATPRFGFTGKPIFGLGGDPLLCDADEECCCTVVAGFTVAQTGTFPSLSWSFTDTSTTDCVGGIVSWAWDFGDTTTSTLQNPTHVFPDTPGPWTVVLTVTDDCGCVDDVSMVVHRIVNCADAKTWAEANISSITWSTSGIVNGSCTGCSDLNIALGSAGPFNGSVWPETLSSSCCDGTPSEVFGSFEFDCNVLGFPANTLVIIGDIGGGSAGCGGTWYEVLGSSPSISTAVFNGSITLNDLRTDNGACDNSASTMVATPVF